MRIGVNCLPLNPGIGGLRQYFQRLFRELLVNDTDNTYIFFYAQQNQAELDHLIGDNSWRDGAIKVADSGDILPHLMKVDLFFCPLNYTWPRPIPIASVVQLADIQEVFYPQFFSKQDLNFRVKNFRGSTRDADCVITLSQYSKRTMVEHYNLPPDKIVVTSLVADESLSDPANKEVCSQLQLPERFVFYPANHWLHKNHDALLKALLQIKIERGAEIPCLLTGHKVSGGYPVQEKIAEYGLEAQVRLLGYVTPEEMRCIYQNATILCFPSLFEGFGMPVLEGMAAGCPVVCSNVTSIPEVAGEAALYFDPQDPRNIGDAILAIWDDTAMQAQLVARGKDQARLFTVERMAKSHKIAFQSAIDSFDEEIREMYARNIYIKLERLELIAEQLKCMQDSLSWKVTAPIRWFDISIAQETKVLK